MQLRARGSYCDAPSYDTALYKCTTDINIAIAT